MVTGSLCATVKDLLGGYNIGNQTMFVNWDLGIILGDLVLDCNFDAFGDL
jgi:hypothetical protein